MSAPVLTFILSGGKTVQGKGILSGGKDGAGEGHPVGRKGLCRGGASGRQREESEAERIMWWEIV